MYITDSKTPEPKESEALKRYNHSLPQKICDVQGSQAFKTLVSQGPSCGIRDTT